jgi:hypothetical protein
MADKKISALTAASTPLAGTEVLPIVQSGDTVKVTVSNLTAGRAISASSVTATGLTSGRVPYATTGGLLTDSANLQFDGENLGLGVTPSTWASGFRAIQMAANGSFYADGGGTYWNNNWFINSSVQAKYLTTSTAQSYEQANGKHAWYIAPSGSAGATVTFTQAMTLDANGSLFVGCTSAPSASVYGTAFIYGGTNGYWNNSVNSTGSTTHFQFINPNGVVGSISTSATLTSYNVTSDYRLKENIAPMTGALAKVAQLKPVTYKWKADGSDGQGFIAHELAEVVPDCVTGEKDATKEEEYEITPAVKDSLGRISIPAQMGVRTVPVYQGMDASFLVATLVSAIQEQQTLIESLTTRLTALENK